MKCNECGGGLTSPSGITLKICPFCGYDSEPQSREAYAEDLVKEMVRLNGASVFNDRPAFLKLINDFFDVGDSRLQLMKSAVNFGVTERLCEISALDLSDQQMELYQLTKLFSDEYGYEYYRAMEVVRILTLGIGIEEKALAVRSAHPKKTIVENETNVNGNTSGNIVNLGLATSQGDWIYFVSNSEGNKNPNALGSRNLYDGNHKLFKERLDGSRRQKLTDDFCLYLNVVGEWVYYCRADKKIAKIQTTGGKSIIICEDKCSYLNVSDGWIYYCNESDDRKIYKINLNGIEKQKLNNDESFDVNVSGDWVYYSNRNDSYSIYKIRTNGTQRTKLNNDDSFFVNIENDLIYFLSDDKRRGRFCDGNSSKLFHELSETINSSTTPKSGKIYRMRLDGSERICLSDVECDNLNVSNNFLYFSKSFWSGGIAKIDKNGVFTEDKTMDGSGIKDIARKGSCINLVNDWIYYYIPNPDFPRGADFIKIHIDGMGRKHI